ncbi:hypothetical protein ACRWQL_06125 [Shewanella sp. HL-SH4]|uniref:hypothetical protein n=1 Tax=Shewanella sp. HL-SH4 TaxID=3436240 RepID=UPI003EBA809C
MIQRDAASTSMWAQPKHPCFEYSLAHLHPHYYLFDLASVMAAATLELTCYWTEMS